MVPSSFLPCSPVAEPFCFSLPRGKYRNGKKSTHCFSVTALGGGRLLGYAPIKSKLQHPLPPGKPRVFDYFLCPGSGEFDLNLGGVGKIEAEVSGFK